MRIEKHIKDLLYRYQCVTVPGFGSFLTQERSATIDTKNQRFDPPCKVLSFNGQLTENDGLLAKYMAENLSFSYDEAIAAIDKEVRHWQLQLASEDLVLDHLGSFQRNQEGKLWFTPSSEVNYLTESFGLASVSSPGILREVLKEEALVLEENVPVIITPERRVRPVYQYVAAASVALLAFGFFGMNEYAKGQQKLQIANEAKAQKIIEQRVQTATFDMGALTSLELKVVEELPKYHIIGGAFRVEENADKRVSQLHAKGFDAKRIGKNKYGLHQVAYASVNDRLEALQLLRKIKRTENREAWLLVSK